VWSAETVLVCALALLGRSQQNFPPVQFVEHVPAGVSPSADAYVPTAEPGMVLVTSTSAFTRARRARDQCGDLEAIRNIAGVLAHEQWHLLHGPDEQAAYHAQLVALMYVGAAADSALYHQVVRSMLAVGDASKKAARARVARAAPEDGVERASATAAPTRQRDIP
jgi:hypothetical protein